MYLEEALEIREQSFKILRQMGIPKELLYSICLVPDDIKSIHDAAKDKNISSVLEIGSFVGVSTMVLLTLFKNSNICCIDPCLSIASDAETYGATIHESTEYFFKALSKHFGFCDKITKIKAFFSKLPDNNTIAYHLPNNPNLLKTPVISTIQEGNGKFDLIFIDADHYANSVQSNLNLTTKLLNTNGIVVLHDVYGKWGKEVQKGIKAFIDKKQEYTFYIYGTVGVVSKKY